MTIEFTIIISPKSDSQPLNYNNHCCVQSTGDDDTIIRFDDDDDAIRSESGDMIERKVIEAMVQ